MILDQFKQILGVAGVSCQVTSFTTVGGGCINKCYRLNTSNKSYFVKINDKCYDEMFETEFKGLLALNSNCDLLVPEPIQYGSLDKISYLIMSFVDSSIRNENYWEHLGNGLAAMHQVTSDYFGFEFDNYIGSLPQSNLRNKNWTEFFIQERLSPQISAAQRSGVLPLEVQHDLDKLCGKLPDYLSSESPAFLHGDLWSGNIMAGPSGEPCLMDPAVYFGNREIELAFTTLFGGFDNSFYQAYNLSYPLEAGYQDRFDIYNIYPLLVHLNLFGRGYLGDIQRTLRKYL